MNVIKYFDLVVCFEKIIIKGFLIHGKNRILSKVRGHRKLSKIFLSTFFSNFFNEYHKNFDLVVCFEKIKYFDLVVMF